MKPANVMPIDEKYNKLLEILKGMDSVLLAFSGGVDSTFLLKALKDSGVRMIAVTAVSETMPKSDLKCAQEMAAHLGVPFRELVTSELDNPEFSKNPKERCFYCKDELFSKLFRIAGEEGYAVVLDGNNADDLSDFRPGRRAAAKHGVKSPLIDAGLTKQEIRQLSKSLGLPTWSRPASPCLSSRFPYGMQITKDGLRRVEDAESFLKSLGFEELRVRNHNNDLARIEVPRTDLDRLMETETRAKIALRFRELGFKYITVDIEGFRSGNLNE